MRIRFLATAAAFLVAGSAAGARAQTRDSAARDTVAIKKTLQEANEFMAELRTGYFQVSSGSFWHHGPSSGVAFNSWSRTPTSVDSLLPIARRALQFLFRSQPGAAAADTVYAVFADARPRCIRLIWLGNRVTEDPDVVVTSAICRDVG